ncbi:MAG: N-acetylglucosamine-6-phosphate deacetylase [Phycisphaeraceae bacterium]|nr:N-acetylglucosamine-6-phosphate deacetylase [Phycisphaeraceae bacterium]
MQDGYFDLQVNGYGGVDFNQDGLSAEAMHHACARLEADGVAGVLATIVTEAAPRMIGRVARLAALRERDELVRRVVAGIHVEGPFISDKKIFRGAYPLDAIGPADSDLAQRLVDAGEGLLRIVTLAPERDPGFTVTRRLAEQGITVAAGHTDASLDELEGAIDAGLTMFTHLGNGTPPLLDRHDNVIRRALAFADRLWCCFIGDGVHVPFFALEQYLRLCGHRAVLVTDAMAAAGLGPGRVTIARMTVDVGEDLVAWAPGRAHLLGAVVTMRKVAENLSCHLGLPPQRVRELTVLNPRRAVGANGGR